MKLGKVVGSIWATQKAQSLSQYKLLLVHIDDKIENKIIVAADTLGAGTGERVIVTSGSAARVAENNGFDPIDAAIIGIVDEKK